MSLEQQILELLKDAKTVAIICNQWGDTGKGKFVDLLALYWADIIGRGTGGANAGHTIKINGQNYVFHMLPSGMLHDKLNIIGCGVAFDPREACNELTILEQSGHNSGNLRISYNAKLVLPQHILLDMLKESNADGIGTTGRGIGPVYTDHTARTGLTVNDLLNKDVFYQKLKKNLKDKLKFLQTADQDLVRKIMQHERLESGIFYSPTETFDASAIIEKYMNYGDILKELITDTEEIVRQAAGRKKILLEGAQGFLLSVDYGTYPYVTASDASIQGLAKGVGISERAIDIVYGIIKGFYMTRVGEGPMPTEFGGKKSAEWSKANNEETEKANCSQYTVNDHDELQQGIAIRIAGGEYGATTKRPRRTGWLDLPLLRHAMKINGSRLILTKLDVLDECETIKICTNYIYQGPEYNIGNKVVRKGDILDTAIPNAYFLQHCTPTYRCFDGWQQQTSGITNYEDLPSKMKDLIAFVDSQIQGRSVMLSVGPEREQTIVRDLT